MYLSKFARMRFVNAWFKRFFQCHDSQLFSPPPDKDNQLSLRALFVDCAKLCIFSF